MEVGDFWTLDWTGLLGWMGLGLGVASGCSRLQKLALLCGDRSRRIPLECCAQQQPHRLQPSHRGREVQRGLPELDSRLTEWNSWGRCHLFGGLDHACWSIQGMRVSYTVRIGAFAKADHPVSSSLPTQRTRDAPRRIWQKSRSSVDQFSSERSVCDHLPHHRGADRVGPRREREVWCPGHPRQDWHGYWRGPKLCWSQPKQPKHLYRQRGSTS